MNKTVEDFKETIIQFVEDLCIAEETKRRARKVTTEALDAFLNSQRQTLREEIGKMKKEDKSLLFHGLYAQGAYNQALADVLSIIEKI